MEFREKRTILSQNSLPPGNLTVWLGIYNATLYIDNLAEQISKQKYADFNLLVVDNASTDDTWIQLQNWLVKFKGRVTLVKNPVNLGFFGSLELNRDLIRSDWFLPIHQDDYYFPNHVSSHLIEIDKSRSDIVAISTDMASMRNDGEKSITLPRGSWFPAATDAPSRFIQNLISITVPQPATSFRTKEFFESLGPWHDWSFTDVELTLKLIAKGEFIQVKSRTMRYRENPLSASHSINDTERKLAAAVGLTRVFASKEFSQIADQVNSIDRDAFTNAVKQGVELRLGKNEISAFICLIAAESLAYAWSYKSKEPNKAIYTEYVSIGSRNVTELLDGIMNANGLDGMKTEKVSDSNSSQIAWRQIFNISEIQGEPSGKSIRRKFKTIVYVMLFGLMPYRIERYIVEKSLVIAFKLGYSHRWNFNWR